MSRTLVARYGSSVVDYWQHVSARVMAELEKRPRVDEAFQRLADGQFRYESVR